VLLAAAVVIVFLLIKPGKPGAGKVVRNPQGNVLLITLDTTRPDRLGCYGYAKAKTPEIDRIAHNGVIFENAYSPVPLTLPAHASILTGTYPPYHGVRNNGKYFLPPQAVTLAEIMKQAGYATAAFVSSFILDSRFGLDQGFDDYSDRMEKAARIKNLESERRAEATYRDFESWLEKRTGGRFFAWVHFFDPHFPYDPPEPYRSDPQIGHPYDGEIAFMDFYVGKMLQLIEKKFLANQTLVILAGDHGEAFGEHKENGHTIFAYDENIRVPLVFYSPGGIPKSVTVTAPANLIDVLPTVLDFLKMSVPRFAQGKSLIPLMNSRRFPPRPFYFESLYAQETMGCAPLCGILLDSDKYIRLPKPELYDLGNDRAERNNLVAARGPRVRKLEDELAGLEKRIGRNESNAGRPTTEEERRRLASLGYLTGPAGGSARATAFDPKDRIEFWNKSLLAGELLAGKKFEDAERLLLALFEEDPHFFPVIEDLGELYFAQEKRESLIAVFEKGIALNPQTSGLRIQYAMSLVRLDMADKAVAVLQAAEPLAGLDEKEQVNFIFGNAYGKLGRYEEAVRSFKKVLAIEPDNFEAARLLGFTLMQLGRFEEAITFFRTAEKGIPQDPRLLEDLATAYARLKRYPEAIKYFEKAVKANAAAYIYADYAHACAEVGDYKKAVELMETAMSLKDADAALRSDGSRMILEWKRKF